MLCPRTGDAVMFGQMHYFHVRKRLAQHRFGVEILSLRRAAGAVFQRLRRIALQRAAWPVARALSTERSTDSLPGHQAG